MRFHLTITYIIYKKSICQIRSVNKQYKNWATNQLVTIKTQLVTIKTQRKYNMSTMKLDFLQNLDF